MCCRLAYSLSHHPCRGAFSVAAEHEPLIQTGERKADYEQDNAESDILPGYYRKECIEDEEAARSFCPFANAGAAIIARHNDMTQSTAYFFISSSWRRHDTMHPLHRIMVSK